MTRVIKARALDRTKHLGVIASHEGATTPRVLVDIQPRHPVTHIVLFWADAPSTAVRMDADITIHDEP